MEDLTGKQFGNYQIVAPLGEGGMAVVYKAYQPAMERFVALKVLPRHLMILEEFTFTARFRREARLLAQLQHPHILPVFDYGESEGYPYIVMPFIVSGTLAELLKKQRLPLAETRRIICQVGEALSYAHAHNMIHRDVKPSNILIDERGNCLLTDFGLARMMGAGENLTSSGSIMGTPAYMSPEQGTGSPVDHRSDIYSLGIILYEMLTGRVPYTAETPLAVVYKHVQDPLPPARKFTPNLSDALDQVLLKSLEKNPEDRYQSADAFVYAIQQAIPENPSTNETVSPKIQSTPPEDEHKPNTFLKPVTRRFPVWVFGGLGILGLFLLLVFLLNRPSTFAPATPTSVILRTEAAEPVTLPTSRPTSTAEPEPAVAPGFKDDFEQQLAEGWTWLAEDPARWSISETPGWLQILASDASFDGPSFPTNVLVREPPAGDFEAITLVRFDPASNFQFAGLVVFQDKGNVLQFGHGFCDLPETCVGKGIYFDNFEGGYIVANHKVAISNSEIYLRIRRVGNTYIGSYSEDGENWITVGEHAREFSKVQIGLLADQSSTAIPALFDFFHLISQTQ